MTIHCPRCGQPTVEDKWPVLDPYNPEFWCHSCGYDSEEKDYDVARPKRKKRSRVKKAAE